ncbi:Elongation factor Tu C-terminal domain containing protein, partial [Aphelenchoides avenae]
MSRHRNVRNINIDDELEEDDDADYYGKSYEEEFEEPLTPGTSKFLYQRPPLTGNNYAATRPLNDYIPEEELPEDAKEHPAEDVFAMDDVQQQKKEERVGPPPGFESPKPRFEIGPPPTRPLTSPADLRKQKAETPTTPALAPVVEQLRVSERKPSRADSKSPARMTPNTSFHKLSALDAALAATPSYKQRERPKEAKDSINLVIVGHVDAGKSTLVGHLLYQLGYVDDRTIHRYKQEATRSGKGSFAFAWILDETEEERVRGVTMDIARAGFETEHRKFNVLDAPGHKDFIPNMITGASQADAALLVVNATRGEFESGFDLGGQTREHALLLRSLGVSRVVTAVNKLDTVDWSKERFDELSEALRLFLQKQTGFSNVEFVPVSGLMGDNLTKRPPADHPLMQWYTGKTLIEVLDRLPAPPRAEDKPLRIIVNDVIKSSINLISIVGKVEQGSVEAGDKVYIMPKADPATVKSVHLDDPSNTSGGSQVCFAGDQISISLSGAFEPGLVYPGHVISCGGPDALVPTRRVVAKIVVFDVLMPILKGTKAELYAHSLRVSSTVVKLRSVISKTTGDVIKKNPRVLTRNTNAIVEIETEYPVCIEPYSKCKALSRISLRSSGTTIAAG